MCYRHYHSNTMITIMLLYVMCSYSTPGTMSGFGGPRLGRVTILWSREGYQSVVTCRSSVRSGHVYE